MSRTDPQFNLRIPEALRDRVMTAAGENKRSATAEILARLEESFAPRDSSSATMLEMAEDLIAVGKERGLAVEVVFNQTDQEPEPLPVTTRVSKEKLVASTEADKPVTKRDINQAVMDAMMRAMEALGPDTAARIFPEHPTQGPKLRKRYPKE